MFVLCLVCVPRVRLLDTLQRDPIYVQAVGSELCSWLGWVTQAALGKDSPGVQKRALRSALSAAGWSWLVGCSAQNQDPGLGAEHRF